jgi:hypothetical protein
MRAHIVQQGEHLAGLAARMGFDAEEVWNHAANEELRSQRRSPQILAPGDILYVPDPGPPDTGYLEARTQNRYVASVPRLEVRMHMAWGPDEPIANEPFVVHGLAQPVEGTTGGDGLARFEIPAFAQHLRIELPAQGVSMPVDVGYLDPVDRRSGLRARLAAQGYLDDRDLLDPNANVGTDQIDEGLGRAVRALQRDRGLEESGEVDDATREALEGSHGS